MKFTLRCDRISSPTPYTDPRINVYLSSMMWTDLEREFWQKKNEKSNAGKKKSYTKEKLHSRTNSYANRSTSFSNETARQMDRWTSEEDIG